MDQFYINDLLEALAIFIKANRRKKVGVNISLLNPNLDRREFNYT